ncbi:DUF3850 domain-containing protein [Aneurinibacillus thermoaerophilus]|uniref:DUF3850 domain-containing protein n=1 Tax=Aneurinibacillus thermoaerophilus TaxID=143495 RepID=UPI0009EAF3C6
MLDGRKKFEIWKNDRGFEEGNTLVLKEFDPDKQEYTGREVETAVTYMTDYTQWSPSK